MLCGVGPPGQAFTYVQQWYVDAVETVYGKRDRRLVRYVSMNRNCCRVSAIPVMEQFTVVMGLETERTKPLGSQE